MNPIINYKIKELDNNKFYIERDSIDWNEIKDNSNEFHEEIAKIILNYESLYFFATQNNDSIILQEELSEEQKQLIKNIFNLLIKNPEQFYDMYQKQQKLLGKLKKIFTKKGLENFIEEYGINYKINNMSSTRAKTNLILHIKKESAYGIFGEILLYTVVEKIIRDREIVLSKVAFITAAGTYSHGSDGIFCNSKTKTLYFGEAKFTYDLENGLKQALKSMENVYERIDNDKNLLITHERDMKNNYSLKIINKDNIDEYQKTVMIFILHGDEYKEEDILKLANKYNDKFKSELKVNINYEIISFPILDKEKLKESISEKVS